MLGFEPSNLSDGRLNFIAATLSSTRFAVDLIWISILTHLLRFRFPTEAIKEVALFSCGI